MKGKIKSRRDRKRNIAKKKTNEGENKKKKKEERTKRTRKDLTSKVKKIDQILHSLTFEKKNWQQKIQ